MTEKYILSASHIGTFKACPMRYCLKYVKGLKPEEETESQRYGTYWHKIQEVMNLKPGDKCPDCGDKIETMKCAICEDTKTVIDGGMDAVIRYLDAAYANKPLSKTVEEWEVERIILLYSLIGYNWYYQDTAGDYEVIAQELQFSMPIKSPASGRNLANTVCQGRIDKIVADVNRKLFVKEHKSTSKGLAPDSTYWNHLRLDTQTTLYPYAVKHDSEIVKLLAEYDTSNIGVLFDVWHRPTIKPKLLTQAASKEFVETGDYCGQKFGVKADWQSNMDISPSIFVNGQEATFELGKKEGTFAIRETPEMFGARLLQDITERPEFYFCLREVARTEPDLDRFERQMFNIYQTIKTLTKTDGWWCDENQCEATFRCPFINICYNNVEVDPMNPPEGFTSRILKEAQKNA